jgi:hypothetical protein
MPDAVVAVILAQARTQLADTVKSSWIDDPTDRRGVSRQLRHFRIGMLCE